MIGTVETVKMQQADFRECLFGMISSVKEESWEDEFEQGVVEELDKGDKCDRTAALMMFGL